MVMVTFFGWRGPHVCLWQLFLVTAFSVTMLINWKSIAHPSPTGSPHTAAGPTGWSDGVFRWV